MVRTNAKGIVVRFPPDTPQITLDAAARTVTIANAALIDGLTAEVSDAEPVSPVTLSFRLLLELTPDDPPDGMPTDSTPEVPDPDPDPDPSQPDPVDPEPDPDPDGTGSTPEAGPSGILLRTSAGSFRVDALRSPARLNAIPTPGSMKVTI